MPDMYGAKKLKDDPASWQKYVAQINAGELVEAVHKVLGHSVAFQLADLVKEWNKAGGKKEKVLGKIMLEIKPMTATYVASIKPPPTINLLADKIDKTLVPGGAQYGKKYIIVQVVGVEEQESLYVLLKDDDNSR